MFSTGGLQPANNNYTHFKLADVKIPGKNTKKKNDKRMFIYTSNHKNNSIKDINHDKIKEII